MNPGAPSIEGLLAAGGYEQIEWIHDRRSGLAACIVIDDTRFGPAFGGIRCRAYAGPGAALADAAALARAMTRKCALAGLPAGGGKAVVLDHPGLDRGAAFARLGQHVQAMGGRFFTGPDVGTGPADLAVLARQTRFVAHREGAAGDIARPTAVGVHAAIRAAAEFVGLTWPRLHVLVQGVGAVGGELAHLLARDGARVSLADLDASRAERLAAELGASTIPADAVLDVACDVFAPCALGDVIAARDVRRLRCRAVVGAANNQLADAAADAALMAAGIAHVPDFVANAGGLIHGALTALEGRVPSPERVLAVGIRAREILERAAHEGRSPHAVALAIADERLAAVAARAYFPGPSS